MLVWDIKSWQRSSANEEMLTDDFEARSSDELSLQKGDRIQLIERDDDFGDGWYLGKHVQNGGTGLFPEGRSASVEDKEMVADTLFSKSTPLLHRDLPTFLPRPYLRTELHQAVLSPTLFWGVRRLMIRQTGLPLKARAK